MAKLSRAEKNEIILNDSRGFPHPDYYVYTTKSGQIQVRKRKISLNNMTTSNNNTDIQQNSNVNSNVNSNNVNTNSTNNTNNTTISQSDNITTNNTNDIKQKEETLYETMTNKMILEKMLNILEKNAVSNDKNLSQPENENITNENKQFVENIKDNTIDEQQQQYVEESPIYQQPIKQISYWKRAPRKIVL